MLDSKNPKLYYSIIKHCHSKLFQVKIDEALKPVKAKLDDFTSKLKAVPVAPKKEE